MYACVSLKMNYFEQSMSIEMGGNVSLLDIPQYLGRAAMIE